MVEVLARFTPTGVGKSAQLIIADIGVKVHPHRCGEIHVDEREAV